MTMDEATKIMFGQLSDDIGEIKEKVRSIDEKLVVIDKHNAEEHAAIHERMKVLLAPKPALSKPFVAAIVGTISTLVGLVGYLVHTLH